MSSFLLLVPRTYSYPPSFLCFRCTFWQCMSQTESTIRNCKASAPTNRVLERHLGGALSRDTCHWSNDGQVGSQFLKSGDSAHEDECSTCRDRPQSEFSLHVTPTKITACDTPLVSFFAAPIFARLRLLRTCIPAMAHPMWRDSLLDPTLPRPWSMGAIAQHVRL